MGPPKRKPSLEGRFSFLLSLCLLKRNAFAQCRVELLEFDFTLGGLPVLASPNNVIGLRGFEPEQAVL